MQALDLVSYIRHGMILKNLAEHDLYDAIIYESFTDTKIEVPEKLTIHALDTKNLHDIHAKLHAHIDHYERVLIILDTLDITDILPVLQTYLPQQSSLDKTLEEGKRIILLHLGTGASGLLESGSAKLHDIGVSQEILLPTFEPYDFISLFRMLQQDMFPLGAVRIPHLEYSSSLLPDVPCDLQQGYIDLTPYELTGTHATLLCHGGHISSCIQAHPFLKDHKAACDMFLLLQYSMPASFDPLLQSIEKTKHVIVVLDQHEHTTYQNYIHSRLREHGISNDVRISLITPDVKNITTHHMHDLYHQAGFSAERLAERIKSL